MLRKSCRDTAELSRSEYFFQNALFVFYFFPEKIKNLMTSQSVLVGFGYPVIGQLITALVYFVM